ncbi:MAG: NAD+ synthase, partial [Desulfovibrionales bacterium]
MKIALLQCNFTVGDLKGNGQKILKAVQHAGREGVDLCITSELALTGYPPRDLLFDSWFIRHCMQRLNRMAAELAHGPALLVGAPEPAPDSAPRPLYNSVFLLHQGRIKGRFRKKLLPNYDVFDEPRYFAPGLERNIFTLGDTRIGVTVCEDIWNDSEYPTGKKYGEQPLFDLAASKVDCMVNLSSSPFTLGKQRFREKMISTIARNYETTFLYVNQVGGNDDLVFDGRSLAVGPDGKIFGKARPFGEDILVIDPDAGNARMQPDDFRVEPEAWNALVLGTRDYVRKSGFTETLIGLSGGIDSSLTAAVAVEALGPEHVTGVLMPSPFTSGQSMDDGEKLAKNLGIKTLTLPIQDLMGAFDRALEPAFKGLPRDVTEENIQARIRGNLLMALSNKHGSMLVTTGNKSELAVGYCTIYGDM